MRLIFSAGLLTMWLTMAPVQGQNPDRLPVEPMMPEPMLLGPPRSRDAPGFQRIPTGRPEMPRFKFPELKIPTMPKFPEVMGVSPFGAAGPMRREQQQADSYDQISGSDLGTLSFEPGEIVRGMDQSVLVRDREGREVVGRLHVGIGQTRIVLMPDGRLESFSADQLRNLDKPFVPLGHDAIEARLLSDAKLSGFRTIRSKRFLFVYNTSDRFIRSTRTILETMYPAVQTYMRRASVPLHEPEFPLVVLAFATEQGYQDYRRAPRGVVAYYAAMSNHVALYERSELSENAPEIAVKNAISTIAHEGVHQFLHNIGVQQRLSRWPMWLSEGVAEYFAPTSVGRTTKWKGLGATNELRMREIEMDWKRTRPSGSGKVLKRIVEADQLESLDYAYSWALIHMLAKRHRKELMACIKECSELKPLQGPPLSEEATLSSDELFTKHFGDDFATLEKEMIGHLSGLSYVDPVAAQPHFLIIGGGQIVLTSSPATVDKLRRQYRGRIQVRSFANRVLAERAMNNLTK